MSVRTIHPAKNLRGEVQTPGDKSISHRSIMLGALARGTTRIQGLLSSEDCKRTIDCFRKLGVQIQTNEQEVLIRGKGLTGLRPKGNLTEEPIPLFMGNSGTTTRLMAGILCGQSFSTRLSGDDSLNSRPMERILRPLTLMGAKITSDGGNGKAPLTIRPGHLSGIHYINPISSAQVKSAILLAGLYADGETSVTEPVRSRNHTEVMLKNFGAPIETVIRNQGSYTATVWPVQALEPQEILVPGDISSAAYLIAAGLLVPGSEILVKNVGLNVTRAGFLEVADRMGADLTLANESSHGGEPRGDLVVKSSSLHGCTISGDIIPSLIDELPLIAVMAACAEGTTVIRDAAELKVKESNRIETITEGLRALGAHITPTEDGMIIEGGYPLTGTTLSSYGDHRIAMSLAIAGLVSSGETRITDAQCVDISYPEFFTTLESLM